jgi:hypothetical protein
MEHYDCCYYKCDRPGTIHIGENGNPDTEWICAYHRYKWNADRARLKTTKDRSLLADQPDGQVV